MPILTLIVILLMACPAASAKDYTPSECPVVGNKNSHIYHVAGGHSYAKMLRENKSGGDNRKCFKTESEAEKDNYRKAKR